MIKDDGEIVDQPNGWTKLYHPRGPHVSLPVIGDTPAVMFACVSAMLDAGFVVAAPGLEVGEERESVSGVLRSVHEHDGEETPIILLYAANEGMKFSMLKLYLNDEADVKAFESACGVKLNDLPVYDGKDKPERDGGKVAQKYIAKLPRPANIVFKQNPKWNEEEANAAKAQNKLYTKPRRVFVRWADAPPPGSPPGDGTLPLTDMQVAEAAWKVRLSNVAVPEDLNKLIPMVKAIVEDAIRKRAWSMCLDKAEAHKWVLDKQASMFKLAAETPPKPADKPAPTTSAPPPPDDDVHPLIAEWQKRLDANTVNVDKLNGEVLTEFKKIVKSNPLRGQVWLMLVEFANANGCAFDGTKMHFVETMP